MEQDIDIEILIIVPEMITSWELVNLSIQVMEETEDNKFNPSDN